MKCRVFKTHVGWSQALFIFPKDFKFQEIMNNKQTSMLDKKSYIGEFEFDENFLNVLSNNKINNKTFWFEYLFENDSEETIRNIKTPLKRGLF